MSGHEPCSCQLTLPDSTVGRDIVPYIESTPSACELELLSVVHSLCYIYRSIVISLEVRYAYWRMSHLVSDLTEPVTET